MTPSPTRWRKPLPACPRAWSKPLASCPGGREGHSLSTVRTASSSSTGSHARSRVSAFRSGSPPWLLGGRVREEEEVRHIAKDPVCGMSVDEKKAVATSAYEGKMYVFCAARCKATFVKAPETYVGAEKTGGKGCAREDVADIAQRGLPRVPKEVIGVRSGPGREQHANENPVWDARAAWAWARFVERYRRVRAPAALRRRILAAIAAHQQMVNDRGTTVQGLRGVEALGGRRADRDAGGRSEGARSTSPDRTEGARGGGFSRTDANSRIRRDHRRR